MLLPDFLRNSKILRWPLLSASRLLLLPLKAGPAILRRAVYDAMPVRYFVTGSPEQFVVSTADKVMGESFSCMGNSISASCRQRLQSWHERGCRRQTI